MANRTAFLSAYEYKTLLSYLDGEHILAADLPDGQIEEAERRTRVPLAVALLEVQPEQVSRDRRHAHVALTPFHRVGEPVDLVEL